jgi:hypothetical protein
LVNNHFKTRNDYTLNRMPPTDKPYNNQQEEPNSHELSSTHYRPYQHPSSSDQNAFGDDSDSEDQVHHSQEDQGPPEFDVYKGDHLQSRHFSSTAKEKI